MELDIQIIKTQNRKEKPQNESGLSFGKLFTDHMFLVEYTEGRGWHDARIQPYGPLAIDPASPCSTTARKFLKVSRPTAARTAACRCSALWRTPTG